MSAIPLAKPTPTRMPLRFGKSMTDAKRNKKGWIFAAVKPMRKIALILIVFQIFFAESANAFLGTLTWYELEYENEDEIPIDANGVPNRKAWGFKGKFVSLGVSFPREGIETSRESQKAWGIVRKSGEGFMSISASDQISDISVQVLEYTLSTEDGPLAFKGQTSENKLKAEWNQKVKLDKYETTGLKGITVSYYKSFRFRDINLRKAPRKIKFILRILVEAGAEEELIEKEIDLVKVKKTKGLLERMFAAIP